MRLNQDVPGKVILIAPTAETLGGDVVYKTTIDLDSASPDLRSGMSVEVELARGAVSARPGRGSNKD